MREVWGYGGNLKQDIVDGARFSFGIPANTSIWQQVTAAPVGQYRLTFRAYISGSRELHVWADGANGSFVQTNNTGGSWRTVSKEFSTTTPLSATIVFQNKNGSDGEVRLAWMQLQHRSTDSQPWGPNLLTRSDPNAHLYVDPIQAAELDAILALSQGAEPNTTVYHKLVLFSEKDSRDANGVGEVALIKLVEPWYRLAYARYAVARWAYATSLHSFEYANEMWPQQPAAGHPAIAFAEYVHGIEPRHMLVSNSFWAHWWSDMPTEFFRNGAIDYADRHFYACKDCDTYSNPEATSRLWSDSALYVDECRAAAEEYRTQGGKEILKPILRGEGGVYLAVDGNKDNLQLLKLLYNDDEPSQHRLVYYHKQLWAHVGILGASCDGEWWPRHYPASAGTDRWPDYSSYHAFMRGEPVNNGRYAEIYAVSANARGLAIDAHTGTLRAWGVIDKQAGRALLWVDNADHTWYNVYSRTDIRAADGTLTVHALKGNTFYTIVRWNTTTGQSEAITQQKTAADGSLQLWIDVATDAAYKLMPTRGQPIVNSTADPGDGVCDAAECTLREAILAANAAGGGTITFAIPGAGPFKLQPAAPLPELRGAITIDGYSQPGAAANTNPSPGPFNGVLMIELDGSLAGGTGLLIHGGATVLRGLAINHFSGYAVEIAANPTVAASGDSIIAGNLIGVDPTGMTAAPNGGGIFSHVDRPAQVTVGGPNPADRNVIAGNLEDGVFAVYDAVVVQGNLVGVAADGQTLLGNGGRGVYLVHTWRNLQVLDNLIAGNGTGMFIDEALVEATVRNNSIGFYAADGTPRGNKGDGVVVRQSTASLQDNSIAGNGGRGLVVNQAIANVQGGKIAANQGGILLTGGGDRGSRLTLNGSWLAANRAEHGAGLWIMSQSSAAVTSSAFVANVATQNGGGIANEGTLDLAGAIFDRNIGELGAGLYNAGPETTASLSDVEFRRSCRGEDGEYFSYRCMAGGGIYNAAKLDLTRATFIGNAVFNQGGALFNAAAATLLETEFRDNWSRFQGGAICNDGPAAVLTLERSLVTANNEAVLNNAGELHLLNSTISGNTEDREVSGLNNRATAFVHYSTLADEVLNAGILTAGSSIFAAGCKPDGAPLTSAGHNLDRSSDCGLSGPGDLKNVDPQLEPLTGNGGRTSTHALSLFSPALDAGDNASCPSLDQRGDGFVRPMDGNGGGPVCDMGAYEVQIGNISDIVVNTTADGGDGICDAAECTLREALLVANALSRDTTISFNIPGEGPHTIRPLAALPALGPGIVLDGFSQPGARPNTNALAEGINAVLKIELDGSAPGAGEVGIIDAGATVKGLVINRFSRAGIVAAAPEGHTTTVLGCYIGTDPGGTLALGNGTGISVYGAAQIGGAAPADRNLISGNANYGVYGSAGSELDLRGSYVGADASGTQPLGNGVGVDIFVGGAKIADSVISANNSGVWAELGANLDLRRTYVGLDARGEGNLGNANYGIVIAEGLLQIDSSRIAYNRHGISINYGPPALIVNSEVSHHSGVGIDLTNLARVRIENSTLADNAGGALFSRSSSESGYPYTADLINSTIAADNLSHGGAGLVVTPKGTVNLQSSTVSATVQNSGTLSAQNTIFAAGCLATAAGNPITSLGHNLDRDGSCHLAAPGDLTGDPLLGPLQDNGGPAWTHALLPCSPALDAGATDLTADQRSLPRPIDGDGNGTPAPDIGAFEAQQPLICQPPARYATITIVKDAQPDANRNFLFYGPFGEFKLDDPGFDDGDRIDRSITYQDVLPGTHTFADALPFRWDLHEVLCAPAPGSTATCAIDLAQRTAAITVNAGDVITATFVNQQKGSLLVRAYADKNGDGIRGGGEGLLSGWWTELYDLTLGQGPGSVTASNFTNANGKWNVVDLTPSHQYKVCQKPQPDWTNTQPGSRLFDDRSWPCYTFTLQPAQAAEVWYGYIAAAEATAQTAPDTAAAGLRIRDNYLDNEQDAMYQKEDFEDNDMLTPEPTDPAGEPTTPAPHLYLPALSKD
jgi:CSLREA domain-containing protein